MSFGFSIGDFFAVGQLAWNVYKSCKDAGGAFIELSHEVIALHTAIKELEDEIENPDSIFNRTGLRKKSELGILVKNCHGVLQQLNKKLIKYKSLGSASKRTWDRLRWGTENLQEVRENLLAHTSSLTLFLTTLGTGSLGRIEKKLDQLIEDVRAGRREETVLTFATAEDDPDESEIHWNWLKEELVDDGFTKLEIEGHKHWIKAKLTELIDNGGINEQARSQNGSDSAPKPGSPQPPMQIENEEEVSDAPNARPAIHRKSTKTVSAEATMEDTESKMKLHEAPKNLRRPNSNLMNRAISSSKSPKRNTLFQPTVEDADEDDEIINEHVATVMEEEPASKSSAGDAQAFNEHRGGVGSGVDASSDAEASSGEDVEEEPSRAPKNTGTYTERNSRVHNGKDKPTRKANKQTRQRPEREVKVATQGTKNTRNRGKRTTEETPDHPVSYVEEESSSASDDTYLAPVLPTDSISQIGVRPLTSKSRDSAPKGAKLTSEEIAHTFVSATPSKPVSHKHTQAVHYKSSSDDEAPPRNYKPQSSPSPPRQSKRPNPDSIILNERIIPVTPRKEQSIDNLDNDEGHHGRVGESGPRYSAHNLTTHSCRTGADLNVEQAPYDGPCHPYSRNLHNEWPNNPSGEPLPPFRRSQTFKEVPFMPMTSPFQDSTRVYREFPPPNLAFINQRQPINSGNDGGGFSFSNPDNIFAEFLRGQSAQHEERMSMNLK